MESKKIKKILKDVQQKRITEKHAYNLLKSLPFEDIGFAKIDHHRCLRKGFPEVIFCKGKSPQQVADIFFKMSLRCDSILATKASHECYGAVAKLVPLAEFHENAKTISLQKKTISHSKKHFVAILTAGTADIPVAEEASSTAQFLGIQVERIYDVGVAGIHRLFKNMDRLSKASVIIVIAGMDGALPSVIGGLVSAPVIAVPTSVGYGASFEGLAALLTMLNSCAPGIATVNIDNGFGAACLAYSILKVSK